MLARGPATPGLPGALRRVRLPGPGGPARPPYERCGCGEDCQPGAYEHDGRRESGDHHRHGVHTIVVMPRQTHHAFPELANRHKRQSGEEGEPCNGREPSRRGGTDAESACEDGDHYGRGIQCAPTCPQPRSGGLNGMRA